MKTQLKPLSSRQEKILLSLKRLDFLSREQLSIICSLGKKRNTNRILSSISDYVNTFSEGHTSIYYLSKLGREYTGSSRVLRRNQFVGHTLMRNSMFIYVGCPSDWRNEIKIGDSVETLVCDSVYKENGYFRFLEVDRTQKMKENFSKVRSYANMLKRGAAEKQLGYFPLIVFLTTTEHRREMLKSMCASEGLPSEVYTIDDIT